MLRDGTNSAIGEGMERKADKKIIAKLAAGLKGRKEHEAEVVARMTAKDPACGWGFVSRLDAFGRVERILCSIPPSDNY